MTWAAGNRQAALLRSHCLDDLCHLLPLPWNGFVTKLGWVPFWVLCGWEVMGRRFVGGWAAAGHRDQLPALSPPPELASPKFLLLADTPQGRLQDAYGHHWSRLLTSVPPKPATPPHCRRLPTSATPPVLPSPLPLLPSPSTPLCPSPSACRAQCGVMRCALLCELRSIGSVRPTPLNPTHIGFPTDPPPKKDALILFIG